MKTKCIVQTTNLSSDGYPRYFDREHYRNTGKIKYRPLHQKVCRDHHGPKPSPKHMVRHLCNNRACYNPEHLAWGTHQDNMDDMTRAGRQARGERIATSKFTEEQVRELIALKPKGRAPYGYTKKICAEYNIEASHLWGIWRGLSWKHIPR